MTALARDIAALDDAWLDGLEHRHLGALWLLLRAAQAAGGGLPDDEAYLCEAAGCGRLLGAWRRLRRGVMRDWRRGADGLWRHAAWLDDAAADAVAAPRSAVAGQGAAAGQRAAAGGHPEWLREKWRRQQRERRARARLALVDAADAAADIGAADIGADTRADRGADATAAMGGHQGGQGGGQGGRSGGQVGGQAESDKPDLIDPSQSQSIHQSGSEPAREAALGDAAVPGAVPGAVTGAAADRVVAAFLAARQARWPKALALSAARQRGAVLGWLERGATERLLIDHIRERMPALRSVAGSIGAFERSIAVLIDERRQSLRLPLYGAVGGNDLARSGAAAQRQAGIECGALHESLRPYHAALMRQFGPAQMQSWILPLRLREMEGGGVALLAGDAFRARYLAENFAGRLDRVFGARAWRVLIEADRERGGYGAA